MHRRGGDGDAGPTAEAAAAIRLDDALHLAAAARGVAAADGRAVGVVVVDAGGNVVVEQRMDDAYLSVLEIARRKAFTAVNFGRPTAEMAERLGEAPYQALLSLADPRLTFLRGGVPLRAGDRVVGAIGVSGASAAEDERYALHAASESRFS